MYEFVLVSSLLTLILGLPLFYLLVRVLDLSFNTGLLVLIVGFFSIGARLSVLENTETGC